MSLSSVKKKKRSRVIFIREALQADLQQNNVYNPFSNNSKAMIREMGNVELFELCETIPKVQCSQSILYWNQGVIYCTCGHFLVESEFSQNFDKWRLDALSIPYYVIMVLGTAKLRHRKSTMWPTTRGRDVSNEIMKECTTVSYETQFSVTRESKLAGSRRSASHWINWHRKTTPTIYPERNI